MKWFWALSALPALVNGVVSAIEAYDTNKSFVEKSWAVEVAAQALRFIIAEFYTKTPSPERVSALTARVMGALENTK